MEKKASNASRHIKLAKMLGTVTGGIVLILAVIVTYLYAISPAAIRRPAFQHYHFRMQVLVDEKAVNFAESKYQVGYSKDSCNADLTIQPIHFHDKKDQMVHIHWDGMTGGMVLKYYGWNYIGGMGGALGYRFDQLPKIAKVPIHGDYLPAVPKDASFYVYTGDQNSYKERHFNDLLKQDLEKFFGSKSNVPETDSQASLLGRLFPKAYAHGTAEHNEAGNHVGDTEELRRINNLIGNVVVFVQKDKPSTGQVKDRFNRLEPLSDSTCAG